MWTLICFWFWFFLLLRYSYPWIIQLHVVSIVLQWIFYTFSCNLCWKSNSIFNILIANHSMVSQSTNKFPQLYMNYSKEQMWPFWHNLLHIFRVNGMSYNVILHMCCTYNCISTPIKMTLSIFHFSSCNLSTFSIWNIL